MPSGKPRNMSFRPELVRQNDFVFLLIRFH
jgi:hypothetical protein